MATSGSVEGSGVAYGNRIYIEWNLAGQEIGNNRSLINWRIYWRFFNSDAQLDDGDGAINGGKVWDNGGRVYNYSGNISTKNILVAQGSSWIGHNADGSKVFNFNAQLSQYGSGRSSASGDWALPTIPRASDPSFGSNNKDSYNIGDNVTIYTNRKAGFTHDIAIFFGNWSKMLATGITDQWTWNSGNDASNLFAQIPNANTGVGNIRLRTFNGGSLIGERTKNIRFNVTNSNPTFEDFDFLDTNTDTVALTGDNQTLIQGKSTLRAIVTPDDQMTPLNSSSAKEYVATIDGAVNTKPFSSSADVVFDMGGVSGIGTRTLSVRAVDSRSNSTTVSKTLNVIPYTSPDINIIATRENGFENATKLEVSGVFARVTVGETDKNNIVAGSLEYRVKQDTGAWGNWTDFVFTQGAGAFDATDVYLDLFNGSEFDIEVRVTDKLETVVESIHVDRGVPIFMISDNLEAVGINKMPEHGALDVAGDIYTNDQKVRVLNRLEETATGWNMQYQMYLTGYPEGYDAGSQNLSSTGVALPSRHSIRGQISWGQAITSIGTMKIKRTGWYDVAILANTMNNSNRQTGTRTVAIAKNHPQNVSTFNAVVAQAYDLAGQPNSDRPIAIHQRMYMRKDETLTVLANTTASEELVYHIQLVEWYGNLTDDV